MFTLPALSHTAAATPNSRIRELADIAMQMEGVIKLYFGESSLPTPPFIRAAAEKAMNGGFTFYSENSGLPSLRRSLSDYYARMHGLTIDPATQIVVTASGVQAIHLALRCLLDPGDEAIVMTPAWPNQMAIARLCNATPVEVANVIEGGRYTIDREALEAAITPKSRVLMYTSPSNPLGWVATIEEQQWLLEFARRHGLWLAVDEVYERLFYQGDAAPTILKLATPEDRVVVIQSFSKNYCMTGWRLGWMVAPADIGRKAGPLNEFFVSHANSFVQKAAETAIADGEPFIKNLKEMLLANRDYCVSMVKAMPGVTLPEPEGAFYLFPRIEAMTDSFEFCRDVLMKTKVGLAPGVAFGAGGDGSIRMCYAAERPILEEAMGRLAEYMSRR